MGFKLGKERGLEAAGGEIKTKMGSFKATRLDRYLET